MLNKMRNLIFVFIKKLYENITTEKKPEAICFVVGSIYDFRLTLCDSITTI